MSSRGNSTSQDDRSSEGRGNAGRVRANLRTVAVNSAANASEKAGGNPTVPAGVRWANFNREDWWERTTVRLFYPPCFPAARPSHRSYPGGHALFVSHQTIAIACQCAEGGGGYELGDQSEMAVVTSGVGLNRTRRPHSRDAPAHPKPSAEATQRGPLAWRCRRQRAFSTPLVYPGPTSAHAEMAGYTVCKGKRQRTWKAEGAALGRPRREALGFLLSPKTSEPLRCARLGGAEEKGGALCVSRPIPRNPYR